MIYVHRILHLVKGNPFICPDMCVLVRVGAQLMHKYGATAATDVTGFGLLGHAQNLVSNQVTLRPIPPI